MVVLVQNAKGCLSSSLCVSVSLFVCLCTLVGRNCSADFNQTYQNRFSKVFLLVCSIFWSLTYLMTSHRPYSIFIVVAMQRTQFSSDYFENYNLKYLYVYLGLILYLSFLRHPRLVKITVEITVENSNDIKFKTK